MTPREEMNPADERFQAELMLRFNDAIHHCHPPRGALTISEMNAVSSCEASLNKARRQLIRHDDYLDVLADNNVNDDNVNLKY